MATSPPVLYQAKWSLAFPRRSRYTKQVMVKASRSRSAHRPVHTTPQLSWLQRLHHWANRHEALLLLLLLVILLRLPSLAEPYWYGDEAIYLTIGNALRHGQRLYAQIVDHKTPLIYYFAMVPNQLWFRMVMFGWMLATTVFFYRIARKLLKNPTWAWISTLLFVLLTNWSSLEGNIPNGELFVMGFILAALDMLTHTRYFTNFIHQENQPLRRRDSVWLLAAGVVSSGGILTKVPGLFDVAAMGSLFIWQVLLGIVPRLSRRPGRHPHWLTYLQGGLIMLTGILIPIVGSVVYYWLRGSLDAYLQFGLLYNFHYAGNWSPPLPADWLQPLFTLPGKAILLLVGGLGLTVGVFRWPQQRTAWWLSWWLWLALFAALLSNRPYPHYFLQLVPPLALVVTALVQPKQTWLARTWLGLPVVLATLALLLLQFRLYPFVPYYRNYLKLTLGQMSEAAYARSFNGLVPQNETVAQVIVHNSSPDDTLFIWGTNPMLYALTKRVPANRFTVAFHIHDLGVYDETLQEIRAYEPTYIVVMKSEAEWPELNDYLQEHYMYSLETPDMVVYRRSTLTSLLLLK